MSRLYLVIFLICCQALWGQKQLAKIVEHADQQVLQQDYIEAIDYYQQALQMAPTSVHLLWKMAQAQQAAKDYKNAAYYFLKTYELDPNQEVYNEAQLNYALMLKQQGLYKEALAQFKEVKQFFSEDKTQIQYKKATQEVSACSWVLKQLKEQTQDEKAALQPHSINTIDAEFGHALLNDTIYFSSLKADSVADDRNEIFAKTYKLRLYAAKHNQKDLSQELNISGLPVNATVGNISFNNEQTAFLCSVCQEGSTQNSCQLKWVSKQADQTWMLDSQTEIMAASGSSYISMPNLTQLNEKTLLFFCANSPNGKGGLDIYQAELQENGAFAAPQNIQIINSTENEISPWFDPQTKRLYFSSTWHIGFGGFDIFYSQLQENGQFGPPINLGKPFNSPANDNYFFCVADTAYLSSNREGSLYASHPTCCSDVFYHYFDRPNEKVKKQTTDSVLIVKLPVALYFENDCPDPKSKAEQTNLNYEETFVQYKKQFPNYLNGVQQNRDSIEAKKLKDDLQLFFDQEVEKGMQDLAIFRAQVWNELAKGNQVSIMVQGFASPLAKSDYNVHLTKRRIDSIKNYFEEVDGGKFAAYMQEGQQRLVFVEVPMGEYKANKSVSDNFYDQRNSVFSTAASRERRIEIIELRSQAAKN
ncbi:MAG: hypothetical protein RLZZ65_1384 [Bacteroidota bacterium]|jgi:hypothetical protein